MTAGLVAAIRLGPCAAAESIKRQAQHVVKAFLALMGSELLSGEDMVADCCHPYPSPAQLIERPSRQRQAEILFECLEIVTSYVPI